MTMKNMLKKELKLSTSPLTFIFLAFTSMTFFPGYPILMGAFFICLGIFQSFHQTRATNDLLYSSLLPIRKRDVVRSKYILVCFIEVVGFLLCMIFSFIRMTAMSGSVVYTQNELMSANLVFLGFVLLVFLCFNWFFVSGFFKTGYFINKPYILFVVFALVLIFLGEGLHFMPRFRFLNDNTLKTDSNVAAIHIIFFVICLCLYVFGTVISEKRAQKKFEKLDL